MFKHILIPTDGSDLSAIAVKNGVRFAKEINAEITGVTVTTPFHFMAVDAMQFSSTPEEHAANARAQADKNLSVLKDEAAVAGVACKLVHRSGVHPYEEIVKTAQDHDCDVIFLSSHGRRGIAALLLGSETQKVLTHTKIPVVVYR
jgi:nucleotide-binding universal stress UspA family protein